MALGHRLWISGFLVRMHGDVAGRNLEESIAHCPPALQGGANDDALSLQLKKLADALIKAIAGDGALCRLEYYRDLHGVGGTGAFRVTAPRNDGDLAPALESILLQATPLRLSQRARVLTLRSRRLMACPSRLACLPPATPGICS